MLFSIITIKMSRSFKQSVREALRYYVYALVDPRDRHIFYIGKGAGDRVFQHAEAAINSDDTSLKLATIREILDAGQNVEYYILRHNLTEQEAYMVESTIIDLLTYPAFNKVNLLTNIVCGHHQWNEGIKTENEINVIYDCKKIEPLADDRLLLVSLNRSYDHKRSEGVYRRPNDYESARKYWKIADSRAKKVTHILGIYRGIVRIVIAVKGYRKVDQTEDGKPFSSPRYVFEGDIIADSPYLNTDVSDFPFGSGGAVTYIPRERNAW